MINRPAPKTITLGAFYDRLNKIVEKNDGGLPVYIETTDGQIRLVDNAYMSEQGELKVVIKEKAVKK